MTESQPVHAQASSRLGSPTCGRWLRAPLVRCAPLATSCMPRPRLASYSDILQNTRMSGCPDPGRPSARRAQHLATPARGRRCCVVRQLQHRAYPARARHDIPTFCRMTECQATSTSTHRHPDTPRAGDMYRPPAKLPVEKRHFLRSDIDESGTALVPTFCRMTECYRHERSHSTVIANGGPCLRHRFTRQAPWQPNHILPSRSAAEEAPVACPPPRLPGGALSGGASPFWEAWRVLVSGPNDS